MSALMPLIGLFFGLVAGVILFSSQAIPADSAHIYAPYLSLATLAGLDTVFGGIRAGIEGRFQDDVFVSGFILNTLLAAGMSWFGDKIGVDLFLAAMIALGSRLFLNLSLIRRYYLNKRALNKRKETQPINQ